jgi:tetratricopeptide (TPR) repeat protein
MTDASGVESKEPGNVAARPPARSPWRGWLLPVVALVAVGAAVWWFVFRESSEERGTRLIQEARAAMDVRDYGTAEIRLREALEVAPGNGVLLHNLGVIYREQGRKQEARDAFERAAAAHGPEASELKAEELYQLASLSFRDKHWDQAAGELESGIAAHPQRVQLHTLLLDLQLGPLADPAGAESTTTRFLRICGPTAEHFGNAADVYLKHDASAAAAVPLARRAVELQDSYVEGHALLAQALFKSGRTEEALAELDAAQMRYPSAVPLWIERSRIQLHRGARQEALAAADGAVRLAPRSYDAHQARQRALSILGRYEEALREIELSRGLTSDPGEQLRLERQERIVRGAMGMSAPSGAPAGDDSSTTP